MGNQKIVSRTLTTRRIIEGKDKTLRDVDRITKTEEFQRECCFGSQNEEFEKRNKKFANPIPPPAFTTPEGLLDNPNFPVEDVCRRLF